jgi:hypothetical protein
VRIVKIIKKNREGNSRDAYASVASVDTIELFFPGQFLPRGIRSDLEGIHHRRVRITQCGAPDGYLIGHRLTLHGPFTHAAIAVLAGWQERHRGKLSRVDIAYDMPVEAYRDILTHVVLRGRRNGPMKDFDGGTYWVAQAGRKRRSSRDVLIYSRDSKLGRGACARLELGFQRASACERQGFDDVLDLMALNPRELLERNIGWSDAGDRFVASAVKKAVDADRERYAGRETSEFVDRFRAMKARKVQNIAKRAGMDRAQVRRAYVPKPDRLQSVLNYVLVSGELHWLEDGSDINSAPSPSISKNPNDFSPPSAQPHQTKNRVQYERSVCH